MPRPTARAATATGFRFPRIPKALVRRALLAALWLPCCQAALATGTVTEVIYSDQDPGEAPYPTRLLLSERYLRIDSGGPGDDFLLLDLRRKRLYSVTHGDRTLTRIDARPVSLVKPSPWAVRERLTPKGSGQDRWVLSVNGHDCLTSTLAPGFLPDVGRALAVLRETLASMQARTYETTPPELRHECDLVPDVFERERDVARGLPIQEERASGKTRRFVSNRETAPAPALFELPRGYGELDLNNFLRP